jgi:hypothetical protein
MLSRLIRLYRQRTASIARIATVALLLAQAIGLAHGIAHPHSRGGLPSATAAITVADGASSWAGGMHDDGSAQCRLLDQLSHADALTPALSLPSAPPSVQTSAAPLRVAQCARVAPAYLARGPPTFLA